MIGLSLLWLLTGCSPSVCDWTADWAQRCKVDWTDADDRTCTQTLRTCTQREKHKLEAFWLCMDQRKALQCDAPLDTGLEDTGAPPAAEDLAACREELTGVSQSCAAAIGLDGGVFRGVTTPSTTEAP